MRFNWLGRIATIAVLVAATAVDVSAQAGTTTATVRGRVTSTAGASVAGAQIVVRNAQTGIVRGALANEEGLFIVPFLDPGGPYEVSVLLIGQTAPGREFDRFQMGEVIVVDFSLTEQAIVLEGIDVVAESAPLIETRQSGVVDRVGALEIENLPTNGRNFADFVALSPNVQVDAGDGSGGNLSLGGGRRGANSITIDGVNNTGTFFGGEARGSDRIAFAFSIETVKEFQVITNSYDVEFGNFNGGQINAVTKSGTNDFTASAFFYRRDERMTGDDFQGLAPEEFSSNQFGAIVSGPIIKDKAHFLFSFDRQARINPVRSLVDDPLVGDITKAELDRFKAITQSTYGYDASNEFGIFNQSNDETAIFARVDWQLNDKHSMTLRHNYTDLINDNDRISTNEGRSNGGVYMDEAHSFAANLKSVLTPTIFNDLRFQYAREARPREAASLLPEVEVFGGSAHSFYDIEIFNDPVLPNSLDENLIQVIDNVVWQKGSHTLKLGTDNNFYEMDNQFFYNGRGQLEFKGLDDYEAGISSKYTIATPGVDGSEPSAIYNVTEHSLYAQDEWAFNDNLTLTFGLRWDYTRFPDMPETNDDVLDVFDIDTGDFPVDSDNIAPRVGFALDVMGDGRSVLRGGAGLFYGRLPAVFWSNALLNTGESQGFVQCSGSFFNTPETQAAVISILRGERPTFQSCGEIPGGTGFGFSPSVNGFSSDLEWPGTWKFNLGYDMEVIDDLRVGVEVTHARTSENFFNRDINLLGPQFITDGNRPVLAPAGEISSSSGEPGFGDQRVTTSFGDVLVMYPIAESRTWSATFEAGKRFNDKWAASLAYGLSRTMDNTSSSCCISTTAIFETPTSGWTNHLGDPGDERIGTWAPADFDRTHVITMTGVYSDAFGLDGLRLSGIYRGQSGFPYTPLVDGDVNADARTNNDRAYIPSTSVGLLWDSEAEYGKLEDLLDKFDCLADQAGFISTRNACRGPWNHRLDGRVSFELPTLGGQSVEVMADVFNILNLISSDWGKVMFIGENDRNLLELEGFDSSSSRHIYSVNEDFGDETPFGFTPRQWQVQLGLRYNLR
jgi:outer membrane receptor protein involved in Fe transport